MSDNPTSGQTPTHRSESSPAPQTAGSGLHCSPFIRAFTQPLTSTSRTTPGASSACTNVIASARWLCSASCPILSGSDGHGPLHDENPGASLRDRAFRSNLRSLRSLQFPLQSLAHFAPSNFRCNPSRTSLPPISAAIPRALRSLRSLRAGACKGAAARASRPSRRRCRLKRTRGRASFKQYSSRCDGASSHTCSLRQPPSGGPPLRCAPLRPGLAGQRRSRA